MGKINIDWSAIRPLNGSRSEGFEELCAQLASTEGPAGSRFERNGPPDAGVECYAVLENGDEWGWQAKYFYTLGNSQWGQLDDSVRTALEKHPRLVRYFVCLPLDLPDARIDGQKSARERWDDHVEKWAEWAAARQMAVQFTYWGSHQLLDRLAQPQQVGRVRFWFDVRAFDRAWFAARLEEAVKSAGPRYTPEIHVDLPIAAEFEAFGRTERFFDSVKAQARGIRKEFRGVRCPPTLNSEAAIASSLSAMSTAVGAILTELSALAAQPSGELSLGRIQRLVVAAESPLEELERLIFEREEAQEKERSTDKERAGSPHRENPVRNLRIQIRALSGELQRVRGFLEHSDSIAGKNVLILNGRAGTGKTHLLCDVAGQRLAAGRPTVLLMGQRFRSTDEPWTQATQQLDLAGLSAEEFVGALEAAAQTAGQRALVLIDALNEGTGREIWPSHLAAFVAHLERSSWIGVVLGVRSSYEEIIIPAEIRDNAATVTHPGFAGHEYEAIRTFFGHYGLELPSTPLLDPEFQNPLFLKILCQGLRAKGERRLPRGFHGITGVFELYLSAVNDRLAVDLDFNPKDRLASRAVERFAQAAGKQRWLPLAECQDIVNALLPGRDFGRSLYGGLVAEGVFLEELVWHENSVREDAVFIAYDRLADHLIAKASLDSHLDANAPESAFAAGAPLGFLADKSQSVPPGLLEAVYIQVAERTGRELPSLAPGFTGQWAIRDAFRGSLLWRAPTAFSTETLETLSSFTRTEHDLNETLEVLLTLATLPEHPLNAEFLDRRLRKDTMPDRDSWWSIFLHEAWQARGAVHRIVDWAWSVKSTTAIDDETVDLCATVLSWMFTTSNRYLRDRATQALANLLTGRLSAMMRLIERFADVNDPYVLERVYAVAYGTAMRSHGAAGVGGLGQLVYSHVFAGAPPAQILLRDYARGVVERAIHLGANLNIVENRIRPPYESEWPNIPSEEDIKPLLPDWSRGSHDSRDLEWSRNRIGSSVMDDDFARYVIGTNGPYTNWLSLRLNEPLWRSRSERIAEVVREFSHAEIACWKEFKEAEREGRGRDDYR